MPSKLISTDYDFQGVNRISDLPSANDLGQPIVQGQEIPLKSIPYASLPTSGLPSTAIAWCPDFQYGTPPTAWAGPVAWNGTDWVPLYAGSLPAATIAGQPLNFSQLGGAATVGVAIITVPSGLKTHEETVSVPGILSTNSVKVWLASTTSDDENDIFLLENVQVWASCKTDAITFFFSSQSPENGLIKLNYQVV